MKTLILSFSALVSLSANLRAAPIVVGHTEAAAVPTYSQARMDAIATKKWFFAHASVGTQMMKGLGQWNGLNPAFYKLRRTTLPLPSAPGGVPPVPSPTLPGMVYELNRSNPSEYTKIDWFSGYVNGGWRAPAVDFVLNKLSFYEVTVNLNYYLDSMQALETAYPDTVVVYCTRLVQTNWNEMNFACNVFNDGLREFCLANNKVLLDVADIEAHDLQGNAYTYVQNGRICQYMYPGYAWTASNDGIHLNAIGYKQLALGIYALTDAWLNGPPPAPPLAPTDLAATAVSETQINLTWTDASADETGFRVERSPDGLTFSELVVLPADATTFSDTPLAPATTYWYRVQAFSGAGASAFTDPVSATTLPPPPPPPLAPTDLVATAASDTQINLTWTDNATDETGLRVERSTDGLTFGELVVLPADASTFSDTPLTPATTYWYRVQAFSAAGASAFTDPVSATTLPPPPPPPLTTNTVIDTLLSFQLQVREITDGTSRSFQTLTSQPLDELPQPPPGSPPTAPDGLVATALSDSRIDLSWTDNSTNETGFIVDRSTDGSSYIPMAEVGSNTTLKAEVGLNAATTYWYRVRAFNVAGSSDYSTAVSASTFAEPPTLLILTNIVIDTTLRFPLQVREITDGTNRSFELLTGPMTQ